jgi:hypothetical protein
VIDNRLLDDFDALRDNPQVAELCHPRGRSMIDLAAEDILTFAQAADWLPRRRAGRKASLSTLWRWTNIGIRGIMLETIYVGTSRCTSKQAIQRFFERVTTARTAPSATTSSSRARTDVQRRRASEKAGAELTAMIANPPKRKPARRRRTAGDRLAAKGG